MGEADTWSRLRTFRMGTWTRALRRFLRGRMWITSMCEAPRLDAIRFGSNARALPQQGSEKPELRLGLLCSPHDDEDLTQSLQKKARRVRRENRPGGNPPRSLYEGWALRARLGARAQDIGAATALAPLRPSSSATERSATMQKAMCSSSGTPSSSAPL